MLADFLNERIFQNYRQFQLWCNHQIICINRVNVAKRCEIVIYLKVKKKVKRQLTDLTNVYLTMPKQFHLIQNFIQKKKCGWSSKELRNFYSVAEACIIHSASVFMRCPFQFAWQKCDSQKWGNFLELMIYIKFTWNKFFWSDFLSFINICCEMWIICRNNKHVLKIL